MVRLHPGPWSPASEDSLTSQILQSILNGWRSGNGQTTLNEVTLHKLHSPSQLLEWVKNHDPILENFEILTQGIQSHHYILMHHVF